MRSAQVLAVRVLLLGSLLASGACFRPKILSGSYSCGDGGACPDGLTCDKASHLCVTSIGGASGGGGAGGTGGNGGMGGKGNTGGGGTPDRPRTGALASWCPRCAGVVG